MWKKRQHYQIGRQFAPAKLCVHPLSGITRGNAPLCLSQCGVKLAKPWSRSAVSVGVSVRPEEADWKTAGDVCRCCCDPLPGRLGKHTFARCPDFPQAVHLVSFFNGQAVIM
eukprot:GHVR01184381.1.p1 GENE.GHVR01184381.1~~GHVR01184381.1.p1  ORF type:complete len:112 (+),score=14.57 GHVR01184381.1:2-337(+)